VIKNIIRLGHVPPDEKTVSAFGNIIRREWCRYVLRIFSELPFEKYCVKMESMKIELTDSGQSLLVGVCKQDNEM
jgi:hypothetical protein